VISWKLALASDLYQNSTAWHMRQNPTGLPNPTLSSLIIRERFSPKRALFAYGGKKDAAIHLLKTAIEQNYCSYSNLLCDPLLCYCDLPFLQDYVAGHHEYQSFVTTSVA
jgi:hypothetical protein